MLCLSLMDWLTFRHPEEARSARETPPSVTEILPELLIGEYPRPQDAAWLRQTHRITAVLNLQDNDDLKIKGLDLPALIASYQREGIKLVRMPVPDSSDDHLEDALDSVLERMHALVEAGERVYLHCNAGINRAPTVAIAFIHRYRAMVLDEAVAYVRKRRVCAPYTVMLEGFFARRADARATKTVAEQT
jgi:protein-tyrosine phosphatase